jgi:uncharacterized protein YegP (UPF0339 family)
VNEDAEIYVGGKLVGRGLAGMAAALPAMLGRPEGGAMSAEEIAREFHDTYERLAPEHGYETREASAKPWPEVPEQNRRLMEAVVGDLLERGVIAAPPAPTVEPGPDQTSLEEAGHKVEVYRGEDRDYRWRLRAANGEIIADSGEGYTDAAFTRHRAQALNPEAELVDLTGGEA